MLTQTLDAYKLPTIADVPEIVVELVDIPDEHLTNLGSKGLGEPPIVPTAAAIANAIRDATGADVRSLPITREEMLRALAEASEAGEGCSCSGLTRSRLRPQSSATAPSASRAAPTSCRSCATGSSRPTRSSTSARSSRAGSTARRSARARRWPSSRSTRRSPQALREACRLAASPQLRSMGTIGGNLLQATRCWYWRLKFPCYLHGGDSCHARKGAHREHAIFGNDRCASAHPSDPAAALLALGTTLRTDRRELPLAELYRLPTDDDRDVTALGARRADPRARRPDAGGEHLPEGDGPDDTGRSRSSASPPRASRTASGSRSPGVAPIPWQLDSPDDARAGDAAPGNRVQGRARPPADPPRDRSSRSVGDGRLRRARGGGLHSLRLAEAAAPARAGARARPPQLRRRRGRRPRRSRARGKRPRRGLPRLGARPRRLPALRPERTSAREPRRQWSCSPTAPTSRPRRSTA